MEIGFGNLVQAEFIICLKGLKVRSRFKNILHYSLEVSYVNEKLFK